MAMITPNKKGKALKTDPDRLSPLPDAVLHHILSFLDMKQVLGMTLLASRWRYLWVSLPVINCSYFLWKEENQRTRFMDFVDRVLFLRDGSDIKEFHLHCSHNFDSERTGFTITSAVRRHLKKLHLQFCPVRNVELPRVVFALSITALELNFTSANRIRIQIPDLVCAMARLTTLILAFVELPVGNSDGELLFDYPVLENLKVVESRHDHLKVIKISTPRLKTFVIRNELYPVTIVEEKCHVHLCAPNLQSLEIISLHHGGIPIENFSMSNLSDLVDAKIDLDVIDSECLLQLLEVISHAKTIDLHFLWLFEATPNSLDKLTTTSSNLRYFKLTVVEISTSWIIFLLKRFPYIETLVLRIGSTRSIQDIFACGNHLIKYVDIGLIPGDEDSFKCLENLLSTACVLEKLVIRMDKNLSISQKESFGERIRSMFRASSRVAIFYYCF